MRYPRLKGRSCTTLLRCSTEGQIDTSIPDQRKLLAAFAVEHEMRIVHEIALEGVSGSLPKLRKDIEQIIALKRGGLAFDVLLVQDMSRFTRAGAKHASRIEGDLNAENIEVYFAAENMPDGEYSEVFKTLGAVSAQNAVKRAAFASTRGNMSALESGKLPHQTNCFGVDRMYLGPEGPRYINRLLRTGAQVQLHPETREVIRRYDARGHKNHYQKQTDERVILIPGDPEHVEAVRNMFRWKLIEGVGYSTIALRLNDAGIRTPRNLLWNQCTVSSVLMNPTYTGIGIANQVTSAIHVKRAPDCPVDANVNIAGLKTVHPPLVFRDKSEWFFQTHDRLQDFLDPELKAIAIAWQKQKLESTVRGGNPQYKRDKHTQSPYLLKGIARSVEGGHPMVGSGAGTKSKTRYYRVLMVPYRPIRHPTLNRVIPAQELESRVLESIEQVLASTKDLRQRIITAIKDQVKGTNDVVTTVKKLERDRNLLEEKIINMSTSVDSLGPLARDVVLKRRDQFEDELTDLQAKILSHRMAMDVQSLDPEKQADEIVARLSNLSGTLEGMPKAALRSLLSVLISRCDVDMGTKHVSLEIALPHSVVLDSSHELLNMCVASTSGPQGILDTHKRGWIQPDIGKVVTLGTFHCDFRRRKELPSCYTCHRKAA